MAAFVNLEGKKFGRLKVIGRGEGFGKETAWLCKCECGKNKRIRSAMLRSGRTKSCGCLRSEMVSRAFTTHGLSKGGVKGLRPAIEFNLFYGAKYRAKKYGLPFDIEISDVVVPKFCPVFPDLPLKRKQGKNGPGINSPSIDRVIPMLGYVKGNIRVISHRANTIKQTASPEELRKVADWLEKALTLKLGGSSK